MIAPDSLTHHPEAILDRPDRASIDLTFSKRAFMQVKRYMWLSLLPCFEGFHSVGVE